MGRTGLRWVSWAGFWGFSWVLGFAFSISLSLLFLIQTSLNSNKNLKSNHTQLKVCTSMNAQQFKPMIKFSYLLNKNLD